MPLTRPPQRHWATTVLAAVAGLAVAACTAKSPPPAKPAMHSRKGTSPPASSKAGTDSAGPLAPLTNLPAASAAAAGRTAVALDLAGPDPSGLAQADVIFEEASAPVRYIAVYQSRQATAGPITGTQPTDGQVLTVLHPVIGYDGAAAPFFLTALSRAKVIDAGYASHPSLYVSGAQGLTAATAAIRSAARGGTAPPPLFRYRGTGSGASTLAASGVWRPASARVAMPGLAAQHWVFDARADRWRLTSGGPRIQVANLVVQTVPYKAIGLHHSVQSARVIGTGRAEVFSGRASGGDAGTAATGTWSKPHFADVTNYFSAGGSPMAFQPGPTLIVLAPQGTRVSTSGG